MNEETENILNGTRILIFQQRGWGVNIGHYLAQQMQKEGCLLAALTFKKSTHIFTTTQKNVRYEVIVNDDEVAEDPEKYLGNDEYTLTDVCRELGVDTVWPFITTLRHYVRTYKDKYYYGFKQNMSDKEMESYMLAVFKYMKHFFDNFKPDIIIAPIFGDLRHIFFNLYAQRNGIPMIAIIDSKIRNYNIFTRSYLNDKGTFIDRIDELNNRMVNTANRDKAREYIAEFRKKFIRPEYSDYNLREKTIHDKLHERLNLARNIYTNLRKQCPDENAARLGINPGNLPVRIILRDHFTLSRNKRILERFPYYPLDKVKKFIYTPLQVQPEMTIDVMGPYFNNQIETIRQIAQSLPDDYALVVKEHPEGIGKRGPSYMEKISRTPNVKLVDYRISTEHILSKTAMVISTSSTTNAEAAFYKKPAVQLGNLGTTLKLPNVFHHTDMTTLAKRIKEILSLNLDTEEFEFQLENYVAAAYDTGFNLDYAGAWIKGDKADLEPLWLLFKREIEQALAQTDS